MATSEFSGFPAETFTFLSELKANNSRDWFEGNRDRYEQFWKKPALNLIDAVADQMKALDPSLKAQARINGSLRRINRDVRFSKDKSPYTPTMHLIFWSGSHPNRSAGVHFVLLPDGIGYGAGHYGLDPAGLKALRGRITDPKDRTDLIKAIASAKSIGCDFGEPDLVNLPKGFEANGDWEHLLRRKAFVMRTLSDVPHTDWVKTPAIIGKVMELTHEMVPLVRWLAR